MLRGYRSIIFATLGWVALCGAQPPNEQTSGTGGIQQAAPAPKPIGAPSPLITAKPVTEFTPYPGYNPDPCYHAKDHDSADLCAQWRSAVATEKTADEARRAGNWSVVATFLSGIAIVGLFLTIRQGRNALHRAHEANEIARNTAEHELRAYVTAQNIKAQLLSPAKNPKWEIQTVWANNGQTPALAAIANINSQVFTEEIPIDFPYPDNPQPSQHAPLPLGPNQELHSRAPFLSGADFVGIRNGSKKAYVWGWVEYRDIFSPKRRRTEFCYMLEVEYVEGSFGMAFVPCGLHNGMDGGCLKSSTTT